MLGKPAEFTRRLLHWYARDRRDLPWRVSRSAAPGTLPDPYFVLISESMLQQTQVATVIPYFLRFVERFPTLVALAAAEEQEILRLWQGLGYYSRARNLHGTAKIVVERFGGVLPSQLEQLLELPGVGRYTAGAIASLAFDQREAILDGNVARVLCRLDRIEGDPRSTAIRNHLWQRAKEILPGQRVGDFNSGLMELGATICTPRNPKCMLCPVQRHCEAFVQQLQERIPAPAPAKARPLEQRWTFCIHHQSRWLIEQRPLKGRWGGLWQFVTVPANNTSPTNDLIAECIGLKVSNPRPLAQVTHELTHRRYEFDVFWCSLTTPAASIAAAAAAWGAPRIWVPLERLSDYPLPRPHLRIALLLKELAP
ncbi:MAG TPA: A/G-specific adenine glycosylase [Tepidisphaeraceae bacterium]|nr:A/G-specific adenine glycosylase [Tepidisphaeraceae bacterium]